MKKFEVFVTKVPLRDNRDATAQLNLKTAEGFGVIFATATGSDLVVIMQRETELLGKVAEKKKEAKKKVAKKKEPKETMEELAEKAEVEAEVKEVE